MRFQGLLADPSEVQKTQTMASISSLRSLTLDLPPSCVEFWPLNPQYAVVGTYNLEKPTTNGDGEFNEPETEKVGKQKPQERNGSIVLVKVVDDEVKIVQNLSTPFAILDIHFVPGEHPQSLFGVASSTGSIGLFQLVEARGNRLNNDTDNFTIPIMTHIQTIEVADPTVLVTAFQWHPERGGSNGRNLIACLSLSNGSITIGEIQPELTTSKVTFEHVGSHDLEAWTVSLAHNGTGIYSGGDDSCMMFSDFTEHIDTLWPKASNLDRTPKVPWKDQKTHNAGVTAILPLHATSSETLIVTGSYDDSIRLFSAPAIGRRKVLTEMNLGGGVWRLKHLNSQNNPSFPSQGDHPNVLILASCMHAGPRIVRLKHGTDGKDWSFEVLAKFEEHKSMNYGSDCQPYLNDEGQRTFITTSFYDRLLCLWRY
ncbi:hypothetical protein CC80DRAFT_33691 [Byssothecium circinans]|uniref:WD40 repeat-like protein n=1 Tax=Byssothecium circinans TaxID=147558 RepID=A0A6A5U1F6_9PLEO|nr:hypothetical protein CC80DRAFT_33691 [Byssothecium circinans]